MQDTGHALQAFGAEVLYPTLRKEDARVVDQHAERHRLLVQPLKQRHNLRFLGDIRLHGKGFATLLADLRHHLLRLVCALQIVNRHAVALLRQL